MAFLMAMNTPGLRRPNHCHTTNGFIEVSNHWIFTNTTIITNRLIFCALSQKTVMVEPKSSLSC